MKLGTRVWYGAHALVFFVIGLNCARADALLAVLGFIFCFVFALLWACTTEPTLVTLVFKSLTSEDWRKLVAAASVASIVLIVLAILHFTGAVDQLELKVVFSLRGVRHLLRTQ
jgi:hypothetical protein